MCRQGWLNSLGISNLRAQRMSRVNLGTDLRYGHSQRAYTHPGPKTTSVEVFLSQVYHSAAETLPEGILNQRCTDATESETQEYFKKLAEALEDAFHRSPLDKIQTRHPRNLPMRALPPGKPTDLFHQYVALMTEHGMADHAAGRWVSVPWSSNSGLYEWNQHLKLWTWALSIFAKRGME